MPVPASIDLSGDGLSRGHDDASAEHPISLPRRQLDLRVVLPYYSPAGTYRIFLAKERNPATFKATGTATATAQGPHTELVVRLDLREVVPGAYFLGTQRLDDDAPYFYPVMLN